MLAAPRFWWKDSADWRAAALRPLAWLYGTVAARRLTVAPREKIAMPVLCVGNFTVGGSGKTPVVAALVKAAGDMGRRPGVLSRGYGGSVSIPQRVELGRHGAEDVGDEPLLLAAHAPVAVAADRVAGARILAEAGCDLVIMDDGFQSARIHMDHALIVIDARYGLGNGQVLPAGPMRAPLKVQMRHASSLLLVGEGHAADNLAVRAGAGGLSVARARLMPLQKLSGRRFLAFAGIGQPEKFFATVVEAGGEVAMARALPDHHMPSSGELTGIAETAEREGLEIVTTEKDAARIGHARLEALLPGRVVILGIETVFDDPQTPIDIVEAALTAAGKRLKE